MITFDWDDPDDPDGNVQHIALHEVTTDEFEKVFLDPNSETGQSRSSGLPVTFGWTASGRYPMLIWEVLNEEDPRVIRPVTAYEVPAPG